MREQSKKYLLQILIISSAIVAASLIYALFQPYFLLGFVDALFSFSGIVLVISGFRYLNNLGAYRIYELILYKFKRLFSVSSLSKREAYIEEKTNFQAEETEDKQAPTQGLSQNGATGKAEKQYEDFAYKAVVKDPGLSAMFYSSLAVFLLSLLLGFLI